MKLSPGDFWALTPAEWGWLLAAGAPEAPRRADLEALMRLYPDDNGETP